MFHSPEFALRNNLCQRFFELFLESQTRLLSSCFFFLAIERLLTSLGFLKLFACMLIFPGRPFRTLQNILFFGSYAFGSTAADAFSMSSAFLS